MLFMIGAPCIVIIFRIDGLFGVGDGIINLFKTITDVICLTIRIVTLAA